MRTFDPDDPAADRPLTPAEKDAEREADRIRQERRQAEERNQA